MKIILGLLTLVLSMAGSFYFGQRVASDNVWTSCEALQASHAATVMTGRFPENVTVEAYKEAVIKLHHNAIVDGFIGLGRFESELTSKFPLLVGEPNFAMNMLKLTLSKYPQVEDIKLQKQYPENDKTDKFMNDQVDWFYRGLEKVKSESHNKAI